MSIESDPQRCPKCGCSRPAESLQGLCPKCLFIEASILTEAGQPTGDRPTPPPLAEVAAAFPQLEILEFIGQGGMGFVFKARQPKLDRLVALKILPQSLAADPTFAERFNREARLLARLSHPGIVTVHDFGVAATEGRAGSPLPAESGDENERRARSNAPNPAQPTFYYLLMEFVDGVNLRQAMQAGRFTPEQALAIVPRICEALQYAHNEGILHRDIKPENILLDAKGRVKIADFGIAKLVGNGRAGSPLPAAELSDLSGAQGTARPTRLDLTEAGKALGTPNYMAPEQRENPAEVDQRADIYSLGVVFYEMLTGELPLGRFAPPSQRSSADPRVDEIVLRALEKEKTRRYSSADEVKTQVETIATGGSRREEAQTEAGKPIKQLSTGVIFRRAALVAVVVALIVFGLAAATTSMMPQTFVAAARVKLTSSAGIGYDPYQIQNEFARMESPEFLKQVGVEANLRWRWRGLLLGNEYAQDNVIAGRLRGAMESRPVRNTDLFEVRYHSASAGEAADLANAIARLYCRQNGAQLVEEAVEPSTPVRPNAFLNLAFGLVLGGVLGLIAGGMTALFLRGRERDRNSATTAQPVPLTGPRIVAALFIFMGLWSLVSMLFRQDASNMSIFPSAIALPIGIGLLNRREWCRRLASWGLIFSFVFTLIMCGWVVGKAFGLFPHLNLVAMFMGQPVDRGIGAIALFLLLLTQLISYPWLYLTLIRHEVRRQFAAPKQRSPQAEWGLTLAILLLTVTGVHVPVNRNWQTGIIFANPPALPTHDQLEEAVKAIEAFGGGVVRDSAGRVVKVHLIYARHDANDNPYVDSLNMNTSDAASQWFPTFQDAQQLMLYRGQATDRAMQFVASMTNLTVLGITEGQMTGDGLLTLTNLVHLREIHLPESNLNDNNLSIFTNFPNLQKLDLQGANITNEGLEHLRGLIHLQKLFVGGTSITREAILKLEKAIPGLDVDNGWPR